MNAEGMQRTKTCPPYPFVPPDSEAFLDATATTDDEDETRIPSWKEATSTAFSRLSCRAELLTLLSAAENLTVEVRCKGAVACWSGESCFLTDSPKRSTLEVCCSAKLARLVMGGEIVPPFAEKE